MILDKIYDTDSFTGLTIEQLKLFIGRPQSLNILKQVFNQLKKKKDKDEYLQNIALKSDSGDDVCRYIVREHKDIVTDKDSFSMLKKVLDDGGITKGMKGALTRLHKKLC